MRIAKIFITLFVLCICVNLAFAEDKKAFYVKKGGVVTEDAMCFTIPSAVELKIKLQFCEREAEIEFNKKYDLFIADHNSRLKIMELRYFSGKTKMEYEIDEQYNQISLLNERLKELDKPLSWYKQPLFWFTAGTVVGIGIMTGAAYLLNATK